MESQLKKWYTFDQPKSASMDGWQEWKADFKQSAPVRFYLNEVLPDKFIRLSYPFKRMNEWLRYRIVRKYHIVDSGLDPGYYDKDTLLFNTCFNLLKDYVEVECGYMHYICSDDKIDWVEDKKGIAKLLQHNHFYNRYCFRSPKLGIIHLAWESTLDDPNLDDTQRSDEQAKGAREILSLYHWWTEIRPARKEIEHSVRDSDYADKYGMMYFLSDKFKKDHPDVYDANRKWANERNKQDVEWDKEDTVMLIRLIGIRKRLWT